MPGIPLHDFAAHPATHVVSLGGDCAVAHNIRRSFGTDTAYCFDWWLTPAQGAAMLLERPEVDRLYDPASLDAYINDGGVPSVRNRDLGIQFFHEFARTHEGDRVVLTNAEQDLAKARSRTARLIDRLVALDAPGNRIAFIRTARRDDTRAGLETLAAALRHRFARADYTVVLGKYGAAFGDLPHGFARVAFQATATADWRGHPPDWDRFLAATGLRLAGASP